VQAQGESSEPQPPPLNGWNPCGHDIGVEFTYATAGYKSFTSPLYPDYEFLLSVCAPIRYCFVTGVPGQCGFVYELIPGCETAMVCALNRTSKTGISILDLSAYNFRPLNNPKYLGGQLGTRVSNPAAKAAFCRPGEHLAIAVKVERGYTTDTLTFIAYPCQLILDLVTPDVVPYSPNATVEYIPDRVATGFAITFGILFFIACVILLVGYKQYKKAFPNSLNEYQLQQPLSSENERVKMSKTMSSYMAIS
jgi:hypothetical protein